MAIRSATDRVPATVEFITGTKSGDYGPYRSVLFLRCDMEGDAAKVWRSFNPDEVDVFTRGQRVFLVPTERKGKPTWDVELPAREATTPPNQTIPNHNHALPEAPQPTLTPDRKKAIAAYVDQMADLYVFCYRTAQAKLGDEVEEETIRCAASSLFISTQRKFSLT